MDKKKIETIVRDSLAAVPHMSLGTSINDTPWVCEVHFAYDDNLRLVYRSKRYRRHSQEIAKNPSVSGNIVKQHDATEKVRGVYFSGKASLRKDLVLEDPLVQRYRERFEIGPDILEQAKGPEGHAFYVIEVEKYFVFDTLESSPARKYELPWKPSHD
ncbi:MAG: hypothetical protein M3N59_02750 [bacterium]|nr:hypothetical protein [bacterium]